MLVEYTTRLLFPLKLYASASGKLSIRTFKDTRFGNLGDLVGSEDTCYCGSGKKLDALFLPISCRKSC